MKIKVAATQMKISWNIDDNIKKAKKMVEVCAKKGANIILLQELFKTPYFCQTENYDHFSLAEEVESSMLIKEFQKVAKENNVVLPISFF